MAIRVYVNGEEYDNITMSLCLITISAVCATLGVIIKAAIWGV